MSFNNNDNEFDDEFNFDDDDDLFSDDDPFGDEDFLADDSSGQGFGEFDDDEFLDDFEGTGEDDFAFDEDEFGAPEDFEQVDLGFDEGEESPELATEEQQDSSAFRRGLFILGGLLVLQLIIIVLLFFLLGPSGPTPLQFTATARVAQNATTFAESTNIAQTDAALAQTQTAEALITPTPSPTATNTRPPTFTPSPTETASPTLDETLQAATDFAQATEQFAQAQTQTAIAEQSVVPPTDEGPDVNATATALAQVFANLTQTAAARGEEGTPDIMTPVTTEPGEDVVLEDELPDAGLFDDFAAGSSLGMIALAAVGLLGVIAFSRRMRAQNNTDNG